MAAGGAGDAPVSRRTKLIVFYVVLIAATAAGIGAVVAAGKGEHAQPAIAGGYEASGPNACFGKPAPPPVARLPRTAPPLGRAAGPSFDLRQSGKFVNLTNARETLAGQLELGGRLPGGRRRLSGDVNCVGDGRQRFEGSVTAGPRGRIEGTLGRARLVADLKRDPPDPGTRTPRTPGSIAGTYKLSPRSTCLGGGVELTRAGRGYKVEASGRELGRISYNRGTGTVAGELECTRGGRVEVVKGQAVDRELRTVQLLPLEPATRAPSGALTTPSGLPPAGETFTATKQREFGSTLAVFFIAVAIVMLSARLFGSVATRIGQPRVMGEVVAGIALGPTVLGAVAPSAQATLFPTDILPAFGIVANLGLIFYMFLVGLELDPKQLRGRITQAAAISNASVALPMLLGFAVALPMYKLVGPNKDFVPFALFMGVAMSITAFPVLARILVERRMLKRPVGALTLACAAIDDVTAWFLIALATAVAATGSGSKVVATVGLAVAFCVAMALVIRPIVGRVSTAYDEAGRVPGGWIAAIFAGVLLSAYVTEMIGIAVIFGAFVMGMIMPRNAGLTEDVTRRVEDFVVTLLLPMFFAYTGLRTDIGLLDRPILWVLTLVLIVVAIAGKLFGAAAAARLTGFDWRASAVVGTLMNTRGLTELIVLNLALEKGAISQALFAMLVIMALVTTFMAGPLLRVLDPKNSFGAPLEEEFEEARRESEVDSPVPIPDRSILVAPQTDAALEHLRVLAEPLAASEPPRELILARVVRPPRGASVRGGLQTENRLLSEASARVQRARLELLEHRVPARAVAFLSPRPGEDLSRLAEREEVDLMLVDGRRPLLRGGVPRGDVGEILRRAPCDVAVLVAREDAVLVPGHDRPVVVPFGGGDHDWAALELGAWLAASSQAPLRLLGAAGQTEEGGDASRLLSSASLVVQQFTGISSEPVIAQPGPALIAAAGDAGLLVIGLSDRWREEGLGPTRSEIARAGPAPILFVRRGSRAGALAPRDDVTRFTWSSPAMDFDSGR